MTLTFGVALEGYYYQDSDKRKFEVYTYNSPIVAVREFKPNFYDILLTDIYMPNINGFEPIVEIDPNIGICFMSSAEINKGSISKCELWMFYPEASYN
jgi:DNA-binding response OmpR family regulator